jgi:Protein of unknown function (DUF2950)
MQIVGKAIPEHRGFNICLPLVMTALIMIAAAGPSFAQGAGQKTFKSPQAAADALAQAVKAKDKKLAMSILGPGGEEVVSSGDPETDARNHQLFLEKYEKMHRFVPVGNRTDIMYIGAENWPSPIPMVEGKNGWYFDTAAAQRVILARRVGLNEMNTINVCLAIVAAQKEYKAQLHDGEKVNQYAQRFMSTNDKHDGLFWNVAGSEPKSPLGPRVALASYAGAPVAGTAPKRPYHGYFYRILTAQGKNAPGGAQNYLVDGKLTKGFAILAYPARYQISGVTTFLVNQDGLVVQKDLGPDTAKIASTMNEFNPDSSWVIASQ